TISSMSGIFKAIKNHIRAHTKRDVLLLIGSIFLLGASIILFWFSSLSIPDISLFTERQVTESTKIYDRNGILLYDASGSVRKTVIDSDQIPDDVKNATVAIEDQDFYSEGGIRLLSILRAIVVNIVSLGYSQGGSTITQQVIKNSLLTNDKTIARKIKEWILAIRLEKVYSKDQILTTYLNEVPYGGNVYGVEEASKEFFNEDASDLDIAQAAYVAAIPQAPTFYSPYGANKAALDARQKIVLQKMLSLGFITSDQYNQAIAEKVVFQPNTGEGIKAPWFVMYVKQYLESTYGVDAVETGGLDVVTTLDYNLEQKMEQSVQDYINTQGPNFNMSNAAAMAIDPKNGDILAMVGSYDYYSTTTTDGNFNAATGANRQPGSTFKPIAYSVAFEKGYTPDTVLFDLPTEFNSSCGPNGQPLSLSVASSTCYMPQDFDDTYRGPISLRTALALSINIPSIQLLYLGGLQNSLDLAKQMGITTLGDADQYGLTLVLGGGEVSLLEMTSAYGTFANDGIHVPYRSILSVTDSSGNILEQANQTPSGTQVIPANIARTISDILSDDQARASE
ncbi:MAG TPA: transglycosylase domain-containing protein, partial [Candidatus Paceibacterota bacterium]|nr:transglycosylase domain-containing protein [Candidatus Paceibacterota bacterium]